MLPALALAALALAGPGVSMTTVKTAKKDFYTTSLTLPTFTGTALGAAVSSQIAKDERTAVASWLSESFKGELANEKPRLEYFYQASPTVSLNTPKVISYYYTIATFTAGAHPMTVFEGHTYVPGEHGVRAIKSSDIFRKDVEYKSAVSMAVISKLLMNERAAWVQDGTVKELTAQQIENFVITPTAITYLFNPYDMGPYAVGSFQVKLPFSELKAILDPNGALKPLLK